MRDGVKESFWESSVNLTIPEVPERNFDTVIVGAGITGLTLATELQQRGQKVLVLEKTAIGAGTTGGTTSHINNFFDSSYDEIISNFDEDSAKTIATAAKGTVSYIKKNLQHYQISCEFAECRFYLFSADDKQDKQLTKISEAHQKVGIPTRKAYKIPFTVEFVSALEIEGQGQFHPLKYLAGLAKAFVKNGGAIVTGALVTGHKKSDDKIEVETESGDKFNGNDLVYATHIPPGTNRYSDLAAPYRSYALSAKLDNAPKEMAQSCDLYDPYHYFRYHRSGEEHYLIVGGFDHKTGEDDPEKAFEDLEKYAEENFRYREIVNRWSSQYYVPADGLPYIGEMPGEPHVYIATGYNGNGITWGTLAALVLADLIEGKENALAEVIKPDRVTLIASAKSTITENIDAAVHFIKDKVALPKAEDFSQIENGCGEVLKVDGETVAAYRDDKGQLHLLSPVCPHMGCNVTFNAAEKSWDCPCHGSRFSVDGTLLNGPATAGLETVVLSGD